MSEVSVNRTAGGGRCLIIDGTRVAGGKPEFSGDNCVCWWETDKTIGVVDDLVAEVESWKAANKKLREHIDETCAGWAAAYETLEAENEKLKAIVLDMVDYGEDAGGGLGDWFADRLRELGIEVDDD